jgi:outer membrane protein assembly factor BamE (lipoprotein component of BamABCDE complex)
MKKLLLLLSCLAALMSGCSTVSSRIEEKSAVFNSLDPQTQNRLKQSLVNVGDTPDMVYIALGRPDRTRERNSAKGNDQTWIYSTYSQEYEGSHFVGYRRQAYFDPRVNAWRIYYQPLRADVYRDRIEEYMRVVFHDGKVTTIEQAKS